MRVILERTNRSYPRPASKGGRNFMTIIYRQAHTFVGLRYNVDGNNRIVYTCAKLVYVTSRATLSIAEQTLVFTLRHSRTFS